uniref:uncharacterized protein LOC101482501 n=1 Tax=Maylandia zebra TaxID=106582 RepID=UPI000D308C5B|nr:uncharacterized protein LOC101482501 [Maylandia zebra]
MKDGDMSLIVNNVTTTDSGTYECRVFMGETRSWISSSIYLSVSDPPDQKNITAASGQNVNLTCRAPNNNIRDVEWSRADLETKHVLMYRDEQFVPDGQHPSFKNRVDLQDRQMKDGDVSLILNNVTTADSGTYECRVFMKEPNRRKRANVDPDLISIIYLTVLPPAPPGGTTDGEEKDGVARGHYGGLVDFGLLLVVILVVFPVVISKKHKKDPALPPPPDEEAKKEVV